MKKCLANIDLVLDQSVQISLLVGHLVVVDTHGQFVALKRVPVLVAQYFAHFVYDLLAAKAVVHYGVLAVLVFNKIVVLELAISQVDHTVHRNVECFKVVSQLGYGYQVDLEHFVSNDDQLLQVATLPAEQD